MKGEDVRGVLNELTNTVIESSVREDSVLAAIFGTKSSAEKRRLVITGMMRHAQYLDFQDNCMRAEHRRRG